MKSEKLKIVRNALGRSYKSGTENLFSCPFCNHDKLKLSVNIDKNYWKCWICDKSGRNIGFLVRRFGSQDDKLAWSKYENRVETSDFDSLFAEKEEEIAPKVDLPKSFCSLTSKKRDTAALNARQYLRERGIGKPDILKWKIGYASAGEFEGRIIIPSFAPDGFVSYFIARSYGRAWPKYKNPPTSRNIVFNDLYVEWEEDVAKKKTDRITNLFKRFGIDVYQIDVSGYEDVGEMSKAEFKKRKKEAYILETDDYLLEKVLAI